MEDFSDTGNVPGSLVKVPGIVTPEDKLLTFNLNRLSFELA